MITLEQMVRESHFGRIKNLVGNSVISKIIMYSLISGLSITTGYGCEQPKDSGSNQSEDISNNTGWSNPQNNNGGSNSGKGGYCDPCESDLDCKEGWKCSETIDGKERRCYPLLGPFPDDIKKCTSDSECGGYHCYLEGGWCISQLHIECTPEGDIKLTDVDCGGTRIDDCAGDTQCQKLSECVNHVICGDYHTYWPGWQTDDGEEFSCLEVTYKDNGKLGDKCNDDIDCEGILKCYTGSQWPEGYCIFADTVKGNSEAEKEMKAECKETYNGTYCDSIYETAWCVKTCVGDADCRSGYYCGSYYISYDCEENACLPINQ